MTIQNEQKTINKEQKQIILSNFKALLSSLNETQKILDEEFEKASSGESSYLLTEQYCALARSYASEAHKMKMGIDWGLPPSPEWMNHYQDWFFQALDRRTTFWLERGIFARLAFDNKNKPNVLELCCGDGFNTKYFYSPYAKSITALDFDVHAINHASTFNSVDNVKYTLADIRTEIPNEKYDNIIWDAAIEHFTNEEIDFILHKIKNSLGFNGILAGYTLVEKSDGSKHLHQHEREFKSKADLLEMLSAYFKNVKVFETFAPERHNLYFYASDHSALPFDSAWAQVSNRKT
jgi:SAM-dependent methyltransferase